MKEGERSLLRRLSGQPLDTTIQGFDLFTGLWWPLRAKSPAAPRRVPSWLVAKLFGAFHIPHIPEHSLPAVLGRCEPHNDKDRERFRRRFDAILCSPLSSLEPHLRWAMGVVTRAITGNVVSGIDWKQLLDDLSIWDRGEEHRLRRDIREIWAERYFKASKERRLKDVNRNPHDTEP